MFVRRQPSKSCQMRKGNCFKHNMPGGPHISWELQSLIISSSSDVHNGWECSAFLNFREVRSSPSPKGDTEPLALSSFPRWRGPGPCGGVWLWGSQLSALWKGPPFSPTWLLEQAKRHQAAAANCDWFHKQPLLPGAGPASEL